MRSEHALIAVLTLAAAQGVVVCSVVGTERLPPPPDLSRFPRMVDTWRAYTDVPIPQAVAAELGSDQTLERLYFPAMSLNSVDLFVAWFRSQRGGRTQPHSPKVCLPGAGWAPVDSREVLLETAAGTIRASQYLVANRGRRALVLYWYQTPRRVVADEWSAKFFTVADGLRDRRTDIAVVRIFVPQRPGGGEAAEAARFARAVYPLLRQALPR
jgi:EpsI family protein